MKINRGMLVAGLVTTVAVGSLLGIGTASAQSTTGQTSVVDKMVEKFNLNRDDVQTVFEEVHDERHAEMEAKRAERLASLVEDGTLTQEQADALQAKHDEMEALRESWRDEGLTSDEIRQNMQDVRDGFKTWAEEQGIDLDNIRPASGEFGGHGHRGPHGQMMDEEGDNLDDKEQ